MLSLASGDKKASLGSSKKELSGLGQAPGAVGASLFSFILFQPILFLWHIAEE